MILRNPALVRDSLFVLCAFMLTSCFGMSVVIGQGITGFVKENLSHYAIPEARVYFFKGDSLLAETITDSSGHFQFSSSAAFRLSIRAEGLGYKSYTISDLLLDGYSTYTIEIPLQPTAYQLDAVTVKSNGTALRPEVERITKADLLTIAGNFDDPVRIAHSQPGIMLLNDQANYLSARGQAPILNSWYLEECEVVNPNHTSNAGTLTDMPTQYGGGVNMFSAQTLGSTDIYTGLNPMHIGRTTGAVIDMHLHESSTPEARAKAGFLGFELGGGTKLGTQGILDLNLRYSFTGLLTDLGADFGGEKIGFYDGVLSYRLHGPSYKLKLFSWAGESKNEFNHVSDQADIERYKDYFDIDYKNQIRGVGLTFDYALGKKTSLQARTAYSKLETDYSHIPAYDSIGANLVSEDKTRILFSALEFSIQPSSRWQTSIGIEFVDRAFSHIPFAWTPIHDEEFFRPYLNIEYDITRSISFEAGVEGKLVINPGVNTGGYGGYRGQLNLKTSESSQLYAGLRHSPATSVVYAGEQEEDAPLQLIVDKYETGWAWSGTKYAFNVKTYYEHIGNMTIFPYVIGNLQLADYVEPIYGSAIVDGPAIGEARYYGVQGQWEYSSLQGWRMGLNQSFFKSERRIEDQGDWEAGRFDNRYITHISISKEIIRVKKEKNRIWNFSLRGLYQGGLKEPAINFEASQIAQNTVFQDPGAFTQKLPDYLRLDLGIYRTIANTKVRWRYALDIQNAGGFSNIAYHYYDPFLDVINTQEHLGLIPVFSIQASW